ncbi:MAG: carboxypeptidase-like regulatory domain-containing protein [Ignavibacteriales bacterium]
MRSFYLIIISFCLLSAAVYSQVDPGITITGKVIDSKTEEPIISASVFLENTTIGTVTNNNGEFIINKVPLGFYHLVVSSVGYEIKSMQIDGYEKATLRFNVELKQKVIAINEVSVVGEVPQDWKENIEIFQREFLGKSIHASRTSILNPEVINFRRDGKTPNLYAYTDSTIVVENRSLGYKQYILMQQFSYNRDLGTSYLFHTRFEDLTPKNDEEKEFWKKNRSDCYLGSRMHFLSALANRRMSKEYFVVTKGYLKSLMNGYGKRMTPEELDSLYNPELNMVGLEPEICLKVEYQEKKVSSIMEPYSGQILTDIYGNLINADNVQLYGYWAEQRVSDMLPLDYIHRIGE